MANLDVLEKSIPVAPLKIAALEGCIDLAKEVDAHLVQFREELSKHRSAGTSLSGYYEPTYLLD